MVSKKTTTTIMGVGGVLSLAAAAYIGLRYRFEKPPDGEQYVLTLEATPGGTTIPVPGVYIGEEPTIVTITAVPSVGYEFDGWYLSGERVSTSLVYDVEVSGNVLLIASFKEIGGPVLIPAYIRPAQNSRTEDWWRVRKTVELLTETLHLEHNYYIDGIAKFKIVDNAGNGVPDQQIAVYSDGMPDVTDYGYLLLGGLYPIIHTIGNPLILTSNSSGEVAINCRYRWDEPNSNYKYTIGYCGKVSWSWWFGGMWTGPPIWDKDYVTKPSFFADFVRLKHPIYRTLNAIHAYWVDNPSLPVTGDVLADCLIKIHGDKKIGSE